MDITLEKTLPNNLEVERCILGAILLECALPSDLRADDFYLDSHRKVIACMQEMADKGENINLVSLKNALQMRNELEAVGGAAYLASLTDGLPRLELTPQYYRIIRSKAALRKIIQISNESMARGYQDEEQPEVIISSILDGCDQANAILDESGGLQPIGDLISPVFAEIEARANNKMTGAFATGFIDLDRLLSGGVRSQNAFVVAGRPGSGKTAFATNMILNMGKKGVPCALFELEMSAQEIIERMICQSGQVDGGRLRTGFLNKEDWQRITRAAGDLSGYPIFIDDSTGIGVSDIRSRIRKAEQKNKIKFNICAVDYIQLLQPPSSLRRNADDNSMMAAVSKGLKFMAKNMDIGVIEISQLSRASEKRRDRTPQLSDLRSSGQIEQDADVVTFVYREEMTDPTEENAGLSQIILAKQRNGPTGEVQLAFNRQFTSFHDLYSEE